MKSDKSSKREKRSTPGSSRRKPQAPAAKTSPPEKPRPKTTDRRRRLSVISPCYNEAESVEAFYGVLKRVLNALTGYDHGIVLVDDGSTDNTLEVLNQLAGRDPCVEVYSLSRNFGQQAALTAGLEHARGDAFVLMDGDLQHPPETIPALVEAWEAGSPVVLTVREHTADASWWKRFTSRAFYSFFNAFSPTRIVPDASDFCLLSRDARDALLAMPESHRFLRAMIAWMGFPRAEVAYHAQARVAGESKYSFTRMVRLAGDAVFSFSTRPLRLATQLGLWIVAGGLTYLAYVLYLCFFSPEVVHGWSSIVSLILILGGFQLISVGLIGEYIARIFEQVKARPVYLLKQRPKRHRRISRKPSARSRPRKLPAARSKQSAPAPTTTRRKPTSPLKQPSQLAPPSRPIPQSVSRAASPHGPVASAAPRKTPASTDVAGAKASPAAAGSEPTTWLSAPQGPPSASLPKRTAAPKDSSTGAENPSITEKQPASPPKSRRPTPTAPRPKPVATPELPTASPPTLTW